jgi:opacity protein-like surface antigen
MQGFMKKGLVFISTAFVLSAGPLSAQTTGVAEITGTITNAFVAGEFDVAHYWGWGASVGFDVTPSMMLILEASGAYHRDQINASVSDAFADYTVVGGPKFVAQRRARPYVQLLVGVLESRSTFQSPAVQTFSHTSFAFQPGVGVDVPISEHVRLRVAGDWIIGDPRYALYWLHPHIRVGTGVAYRP